MSMTNRLAAESSPYLLQHAQNPVDWYPWGDEAFDKAQREDKPIFLSVGYSTCHWCHVMEHESFESEGVAAVLNEHFVPVKVDREERPDIDRVYMAFVQATTGAGGWPMSVWLTPQLQPFYGGTYFPPTSRWGRPGFVDVLVEIGRLWREERPRIEESAEALTGRLREVTEAARGTGTAGPVAPVEALADAADQYRRAFDRRFGGFGQAPKFPRPSELLFLLRESARTGNGDLLDMVRDTLRAMSLGGMRDHVGGGFHRYSVDAEWRVPHFEKMLYDQAQLVLALLELAQASGEVFWLSVADDTLGYVRRDLSHPDGGFYSAEDADSVPPELAGVAGAHKTEGAFYLWSTGEIDELMGADAEVVARRFDIRPGGNALGDPQDEFGTNNLLYIAAAIEEVASATGRSPDDVVRVLGEARGRMFERRAGRPRPHLDDKVLTAWNGLMIAACARAARAYALGDFDPGGHAARLALHAAERAAEFVRARLWDEARGVLLRRFRDGRAGIDGYCEDYAYLIWGVLELFQSTGEARWLDWAVRLQERQDELFWDDLEGGWFSTTGEDPTVLLRLKEDYDGAEPAPSSVAVHNLIVLVHLIPRDDWSARAERTLGRLGARAGEAGRAVPFLLSALAAWHAPLQQIVVVGAKGDEVGRALWRATQQRFLPFSITLPVEPGPSQEALSERLPFLRSLVTSGGQPTAYVCRGFTCDRPVSTAEELAQLIA
jgi:uncharacterized protein